MPEPLSWHYGLMAEYWSVSLNDTPEIDFLLHAIRRSGQPALDLACGVGRLLVPLLQAGIDIDGADLSADMLAHCAQYAAAAGYHPALLHMPMHTLVTPRLYRTIYICGSFGLAGSAANDLETLRCCYAALEPGGTLVLDTDMEYQFAESWSLWLPEKRRSLPEPYPSEPRRRVAADGTEYRLYTRTLLLNPLEQTFTSQMRIEKWSAGGERLASEEASLRGQMYFKNEVELMLRLAGFSAITVTGDWAGEPATPDTRQIVFTANK